MRKSFAVAAVLATMAFLGSIPRTARAHEEYDNPNGVYIESAVSKLPAKKAAEFRETMKGAHEENIGIYEQIRQVHKDIRAILTSEKYDPNAFIAKSNELQGLHNKITENWTAAFASATEDLSQKERKTLVGAIHPMQHKHHMAKRNEYPKPPKENGPVTR